jgi:non-heme chloroperoxidase
MATFPTARKSGFRQVQQRRNSESLSHLAARFTHTFPTAIFLAGAGDTAHRFDAFAPRFTGQHHVYGITRRGFGASSKPSPANGNYSADHLGDDVLAVMKALHVERPVLVGHSLAGQELSSIGSRFPGKVSGLIYLDAATGFAFYDPPQPPISIEMNDIKRRIDEI